VLGYVIKKCNDASHDTYHCQGNNNKLPERTDERILLDLNFAQSPRKQTPVAANRRGPASNQPFPCSS